MAGINVSIPGLSELAEGLGNARGQTTNDIETIKASVQSALSEAQRLHDERKDELANAIEALKAVDDEEDDYAERLAVELAKAELQRAVVYLSEINLAASSLFSVVAELGSRLDGQYAAARQFLDERIVTAKSYVAIEPEVRAGGASAAEARAQSNTTPHPTAEFSIANATIDDLPALPGKLAWVPIDEIDLRDVSDDLEFKKADRDHMTTMMRAFETHVVPKLGEIENPMELLVSLQRESPQTVTPSDPAFAYECMLGGFGSSDTIAVDSLRAGPAALRGITSGRHRILIAKKLGWSHVPAKVLGGK